MEVSVEEWRRGELGEEKLRVLEREFARDGVFVLRNVLPPDATALLAPRMLSDATALLERRAWRKRGETGGGEGAGGDGGHLQLGPPHMAPWIHPDVHMTTALWSRWSSGSSETAPC